MAGAGPAGTAARRARRARARIVEENEYEPLPALVVLSKGRFRIGFRVAPWEREMFLFFGGEQLEVASDHLAIPLPPDAGYAAMMATAYFVIGHIQTQFPPWFREHMSDYMALQRSLFADSGG